MFVCPRARVWARVFTARLLCQLSHSPGKRLPLAHEHMWLLVVAVVVVMVVLICSSLAILLDALCQTLFHSRENSLSYRPGPSHRLWRWGGHGRGSGPREKFQKMNPIASISGHLVPCECTVTTMKDFLILQQTKKTLRSGTNITLPGKNFKN